MAQSIGDDAVQVGIRPVSPSPEILALAARGYERIFGVSLSSQWEVEDRIDRPRSTIFRIVAYAPHGKARAYYKTVLVPDSIPKESRDETIRRHIRSLRVEDDLATELAACLEGTGIVFDRPLALVPDALTGVRVHVRGRELGRTFRYTFPRLSSSSRLIFTQIGKALSAIDEVGSTYALPPVGPTQRAIIDADLLRAHTNLPDSTLNRVRALVYNLLEDSNTARPSWVHRDVSQSNLLVRNRRSIGIVDFTWDLDLRHRDLTYLLARIGVERVGRRANTYSAFQLVLDNYGGPDVLTQASFHLSLLQRALKWRLVSQHRALNWSDQTIRALLRKPTEAPLVIL